MRRIVLLAFAGVLALGARAQIIANPGFEELIDCPPVFGPEVSIQVTMADWLTVQGTPDGFHASCPAIDPASTPDVPALQTGEGYGGFWGPGEVMGQDFAPVILRDVSYCLSFDAQAVNIFPNNIEEGHPCLQLCVYGSTVAPTMPMPWSLPVPVEEMPGTALLGCSQPVSLSDWSQRSVSFITDVDLPYLFFTSWQDAQCGVGLSPYIAVDNMVLEDCSNTGVDERASATLLGPNPAADHVLLACGEAALRVQLIDQAGRVVLERTLTGSPARLALDGVRDGLYVLAVQDAHGRGLFRERLVVEGNVR